MDKFQGGLFLRPGQDGAAPRRPLEVPPYAAGGNCSTTHTSEVEGRMGVRGPRGGREGSLVDRTCSGGGLPLGLLTHPLGPFSRACPTMEGLCQAQILG